MGEEAGASVATQPQGKVFECRFYRTTRPDWTATMISMACGRNADFPILDELGLRGLRRNFCGVARGAR